MIIAKSALLPKILFSTTSVLCMTSDFITLTKKIKEAKSIISASTNINTLAVFSARPRISRKNLSIRSTAGFMITFKGLWRTKPETFANLSAKKLAVLSKYLVVVSIGKRINAVRRLKISCIVEQLSARLNSSLLVTWLMATSVFVTVVPMLAPMTIGMALRTLNAPEATNATTIEVVVEELCIMLVAKRPTNRPINGLDVVRIRYSANPLPKPLKA